MQQHLSPARQCDDARVAVAALRRKVFEARRSQSADVSRLQETISRRHEEVLKEKKVAAQILAERAERDAEAKRLQREAELQRRDSLRDAMYGEFEKRRDEVAKLKSSWKSTSESAKKDREAFVEYLRRQVKEDRATNTHRRQDVVESVEAQRLSAHEARKVEMNQNRSYMEQRSADRSLTIAASVRDVKNSTMMSQEARRRVEERNLEVKRTIVNETMRMRKNELQTLQKEQAALQSELSFLSRF